MGMYKRFLKHLKKNEPDLYARLKNDTLILKSGDYVPGWGYHWVDWVWDDEAPKNDAQKAQAQKAGLTKAQTRDYLHARNKGKSHLAALKVARDGSDPAPDKTKPPARKTAAKKTPGKKAVPKKPAAPRLKGTDPNFPAPTRGLAYNELKKPPTNADITRLEAMSDADLVSLFNAHVKKKRGTRPDPATLGPIAGTKPATAADIEALKARGVGVRPDLVHVHVRTGAKRKGQMYEAYGYDRFWKQQSVYAPEDTDASAKAKFSRQSRVSKAMPRVTKKAMSQAATDDDALAIAIMLLTGARVGGDSDNGAIGITTIQAKHVKITGSKVVLTFRGKSGGGEGGVNKYEFSDTAIAKALRDRLQGLGPDDKVLETDRNSTIDWVRGASGVPDMKNHDLRTYMANVVAMEYIARAEKAGRHHPSSEAERKRWIREVADAVAAQLNDKTATVLKSYIDPALFDRWTV